jgi:hypothetical protein
MLVPQVIGLQPELYSEWLACFVTVTVTVTEIDKMKGNCWEPTKAHTCIESIDSRLTERRVLPLTAN